MLINLTTDQSKISYATFRSEADRDKLNLIIDLSGIPTDGQEVRTDEAIRLYKHYTDQGYTVYIILHGSMYLWSRNHMIDRGVPASQIHESDLCYKGSHTLEDECEFCMRFYNAFKCGHIHSICAKKHCLTKQFSYIHLGIMANMHSVDNADYVRSNTGHRLSLHNMVSYLC